MDPLLGILSDTHGDAAITRSAVAILRDHGAGLFVHCGDVGGEAVLDELAGTGCRFVWGNTDVDREGLERYAADLGLICLGEGGVFEWAGRRVGVAHGDRPGVLRRLLGEAAVPGEAGGGGDAPASPATAPPVDLLLTGHSHVPHDRNIEGVRWINPGALYRARTRTVALLSPAGEIGREPLESLVVPTGPGWLT